MDIPDTLKRKGRAMALNAQTLEGHWQEIKGKLRERWGVLTDDDLQRARGSVEQLVGTVQRRTGETSDTIRQYLEDLLEDGNTTVRRATEAVQGLATQATSAVQDAAQQASERVREGMREGKQVIRQHPLESVLTCFGAGIVTGVVLGVLCRPR
jgi:uncharacterized protein YjbJ (UPF0337 family)